MTSADRNDDLSPAQEKLEWVTPKISLMEAENTEGKTYIAMEARWPTPGMLKYAEFGPS